MAVKIPTTKELFDAIISDINTEFGITVPFFGKIFLYAFAAVQSGTLKLFYLTLGSVQKNIAPDTAEEEANGGTLERWGRIKLGRNPTPSTNAIYNVIPTGSVGAIIKAGTTFKSDDSSLNPGKLYINDSDYTLITGINLFKVRSLETGSIVSLSDGDKLTVTAPIALVDKQISVSSEDTQPIDAESIELYRERVIESFQLEPQGGASSDYRIWASDAQGVRKVYPFANPNQCSGVVIFIEATISDSIDGKGTPTAQIIQDVESVVNFDPDITKSLEERGRRPLQVLDLYSAITLNQIEIEIQNFQGLTGEIQTSIQDAVNTFLYEIRPYVAGADIPENKNDVLSVNDLIVVINSAIPKTTFFDILTLKVNGNVIVSNYIFVDGNIPTLDSINYV